MLKDASRRAALQAALASKVEVSIAKDQLPDDPARIQELTLTVRGEDLDLVLGKEG